MNHVCIFSALMSFVTFVTLVDKKGENYIESFDRFALLDLVSLFIHSDFEAFALYISKTIYASYCALM